MQQEYWTLDSQLRKASVIEGYESFIWTERRSVWGDFEIHTAATQSMRSLLAVGTMLGMSLSTYIMVVETISDVIGDDGAENLKITGRSLEAILEDRVAMSTDQVSDIVTNPKWVLTDTPGNIIRAVFQYICVDLSLDAGDAIPFYHTGTILPAGSIAESSDTIVANLDPTTVYAVATTIADTYGICFGLVRNGETSEVYFEVYTGSDRTSDQTDRDPVI
jgi:hypothetical protein